MIKTLLCNLFRGTEAIKLAKSSGSLAQIREKAYPKVFMHTYNSTFIRGYFTDPRKKGLVGQLEIIGWDTEHIEGDEYKVLYKFILNKVKRAFIMHVDLKGRVVSSDSFIPEVYQY